MQITITIPKLTTILGHWKWGLLASGAAIVVALVVFPLHSPSTLEATDAMPCSDLDGDGEVTQTDADILTTYNGQFVPPAPPQVDLDGNGQVGFSDALIMVVDMGIFTGCQDKPVTFKGKAEININPVQKDPGPPPFGCYSVKNELKVFLFTVCDNNTQAGFPQTQPFPGLCDLDTTEVCEDSDPTKGKIRVSVLPANYNVVESKAPPNYDPTNTAQQSCTAATTNKCELTFQNTASVLAWFPEDVDGNGLVALGDFMRLLEVFRQPKPQ